MTDIPAFHYGSHYSNAGVVLFYLMRLEPYASLHVELQVTHYMHSKLHAYQPVQTSRAKHASTHGAHPIARWCSPYVRRRVASTTRTGFSPLWRRRGRAA
jgi:hypothetical protein